MLLFIGFAWSAVALTSKSWLWGTSLGELGREEHLRNHPELSAADILTLADIRTRAILPDVECLNGTFVFGSPVVTQLYLLNVALRASGLTCLEGNIEISSPQKVEDMTDLVTLKGSLKINCTYCIPETPFPKLEEIIFTTTKDTPAVFYSVPLYTSVYTPLGISGLIGSSLTFPRLRFITLSSADRIATDVYFAGFFLLSNINFAFSFPALYKIVTRVSLERDGDFLRGITWRYQDGVTINMPRFQELEVQDLALKSGALSTTDSIFGWFMSNNVVNQGLSFPSFTTLTVQAVGRSLLNAGIATQDLASNHGPIAFDSLSNISIIAGAAFMLVSSQFQGLSANALETFSLANDLSLGNFFNGLVFSTAESGTPMTFNSLTSVFCAVRQSSCFAVFGETSGRSFSQAVYMPKLKTIRAYGSVNAYGVRIFGSPTTILLLSSLELVSLSAPVTVSVFAGPQGISGSSFALDAPEEEEQPQPAP
eukprot:gb/GEZN01004754.1/.p1 GENE.gb/GEZN01004754.1/~~gb/GEZN01004754.1/.p1  ORF type:complete len:482 (-),score=48.83 gb/GEZN01004754.1/:440-1885(-)